MCIREAIQGQDPRFLAQRKLKAHLTGRLHLRKRDIARFEELGKHRGFERVELKL